MAKTKKTVTLMDLYRVLMRIDKKTDRLIASLARINKKLDFSEEHDHDHYHDSESPEYKA